VAVACVNHHNNMAPKQELAMAGSSASLGMHITPNLPMDKAHAPLMLSTTGQVPRSAGRELSLSNPHALLLTA